MSDIHNWIGGLLESLVIPFTNLAQGINAVKEKIVSGFMDIGGHLQNMIAGIMELPQKIVDAMNEMMIKLFVPSPDYIDKRVGVIREKFGFVDSITETVGAFQNALSGTGTPPSISVELGNSTGKLNWGSTVTISFGWFAPYRQSAHALLSSIIYLVFAWNVFTHLPSIINGVGSASVTLAKTEKE